MKMKQEGITKADFEKWALTHETLYASTFAHGKQLRAWVNLSGGYKVTHGDETLYAGGSLVKALNCYNENNY